MPPRGPRAQPSPRARDDTGGPCPEEHLAAVAMLRLNDFSIPGNSSRIIHFFCYDSRKLTES